MTKPESHGVSNSDVAVPSASLALYRPVKPEMEIYLKTMDFDVKKEHETLLKSEIPVPTPRKSLYPPVNLTDNNSF